MRCRADTSSFSHGVVLAPVHVDAVSCWNGVILTGHRFGHDTVLKQWCVGTKPFLHGILIDITQYRGFAVLTRHCVDTASFWHDVVLARRRFDTTFLWCGTVFGTAPY